jgi:hypothetical protein
MSISLGATRTFRLKDFATKGQRTKVDLEMLDRSYIIMGGDMQAKYTHEVRHNDFYSWSLTPFEYNSAVCSCAVVQQLFIMHLDIAQQ